MNDPTSSPQPNKEQEICHTPKPKAESFRGGGDFMLSIITNVHSKQSKQPLHYIWNLQLFENQVLQVSYICIYEKK